MQLPTTNPYLLNPFGQNPFMQKMQGGMQSLGGLLGSEDPRTQGLLGMASSLLASSGYSPTPTTFGQALGQGVAAGQASSTDAQMRKLQADLLKKQLTAKPKVNAIPVAKPDGSGAEYVDEADAIGRAPFFKPGQEHGAYQPGDYTPESWAEFIKTANPAVLKRYITPRQEYSPSYQNVSQTLPDGSTQQGTFDTRTGAYSWTGPIVAPGKKQEAEARGRKVGEASGTAAADLPRTEMNAEQALQVVQDLKKHPGLHYIVGPYSWAPVIPGTPQAGADALAKQVQGKTFLEAFNTLKGGGQITEVEGAKAEAAIARLQRAQSRREYIQALSELEEVINIGVNNARKRAGVPGKETPAERAKRLGL